MIEETVTVMGVVPLERHTMGLVNGPPVEPDWHVACLD